MKKCNSCKIRKNLSEFSKLKISKDGVGYCCRQCNKEYKQRIHREPKGILGKIYNDQKGSSKKRNHPQPNYTVDEFREWAFNQPNWDELFDNYKKSGFKPMLIPSGDRIDCSLPYTLDNIQLITREQHYKKTAIETSSGKTGMCKPVIGVCVKTGKVISFMSISEAGKNGFHRAHVGECCNGILKTHAGYTWKYA